MCWFSKHDGLRVWPEMLYCLIRCSLLQLVPVEWVQDVRITQIASILHLYVLK